ncbi:unnamed protein product, partial [Amoebophrya sp. A120]
AEEPLEDDLVDFNSVYRMKEAHLDLIDEDGNDVPLEERRMIERYSVCCIFVSGRDLFPQILNKDGCVHRLSEQRYHNSPQGYSMTFHTFVQQAQVQLVYPNMLDWPGGSKFAQYPGTVKAYDNNAVKVLWHMASGYEAERIVRVGKRLK